MTTNEKHFDEDNLDFGQSRGPVVDLQSQCVY